MNRNNNNIDLRQTLQCTHIRIDLSNKAFRHVETLFIQGGVKDNFELTGVNLFDYVNGKEVLNKNSTLED